MYLYSPISVINENPYMLTAVATAGVLAMVDGSPHHKTISTTGLMLKHFKISSGKVRIESLIESSVSFTFKTAIPKQD